MEKQHITWEQLSKYHANQLLPDEELALLSHISKCTYCADLYAESFQRSSMLLPAPKNLKDSILVEVKHTKTVSSKKQFFFYSLRVCTAMCGALFLLFSAHPEYSTTFQNKVTIETETIQPSFLDEVKDSIQDFTFTINEKVNQITIQ